MFSVSPTNSESTTFDVKGVNDRPCARRMRIADGVVGHLHVPEYVHLTAAPDAAIAVLVGGEILEDRFHALLFASAGFSRAVCELPVTPKVLLAAMFRSNMNES